MLRAMNWEQAFDAIQRQDSTYWPTQRDAAFRRQELAELLEALFDLAGQKQTKNVEDLLSSEMEEYCKAKLSSRPEEEHGD